ncbi:protein-export membrane protein SecF [Candidatus Nomurabacteria bacterium RIFCSPLOWO2_01_FULL_42_20]|uniref:Protein-export membrane protein SecF n=1 Tax=Candidatus Nomurabacteria bacterium RIFCSPHIGHO2_01_FULL_42_16 TaxID=1801743 RepID=A0A1F6VKC1_9BACT|nr:MAG: protein-export membrane protein SecF [Candidatus Nomurabacteria bacterium RIFCSPHIGHO2_01_FULL_42_16]OGI91770.1 MAG: protein-export membrane protein SecF [Candidatus Nomurabacteria bacterium RIFCSPLOWO2_01_FULL_42_20]
MYIINNKKIFILISVALVALALTFIFVFGLKLSIDFKGGALAEINYPDGRPEISLIQDKVNSLGLGNVLVQPTGENGYLVKTKDLTEPERVKLFDSFSIDGEYGVDEKSFTSIGPSVGKELRRKALISMILVILAIIIFIAFVFRSVSRPVSSWKYGVIAILALIHDVAIPTGLFAILGKYAGAEVDTLFVVGLLTIMGLSVNDTIVVFDRIRENLKAHTSGSFAETVGKSIKQTFTRSINTSLTVILALLVLYFFGPASTKYFALTLTAGMFFGTYSSIFLASPLLVLTENIQRKKHK